MQLEGARALFISTLSPGLRSGGFQCTLAFLEAVVDLHQGRVAYIGPPMADGCPSNLHLEKASIIYPRTLSQFAMGFMRYGAFERYSASIEVRSAIQAAANTDCVVYINGERGGGICRYVSAMGLPVILIYHNYVPEYLRSQNAAWTLPRALRSWGITRIAEAGYRHATMRVFLTDEDKLAYKQMVFCNEDAAVNDAKLFFGCREWSGRVHEAADRVNCDKKFCINADLSRHDSISGINSFLMEVWPGIVRRFPDVSLIVAGKKPDGALRDIINAIRNVTLIGSPAPGVMEDILKGAFVCVATSNIGSGIKVRVAEALSYGVPVLCTPHCFRGYHDISDEVIKVYKDPDEALRHVCSFMQADHDKLSMLCRCEYEKHLGYKVGSSRFSELIINKA